MILRESLQLRILAIGAGFSQLALNIEAAVRESRALLLAAGHEPPTDPNVVPLHRA